MAETERTTRRVKRTVRENRVGAADADGVRNINVVDPSNVVVSMNLGDPGSTHGASAKQTLRMRQNGGATVEETETVERRF
jgi:hypothetical protein